MKKNYLLLLTTCLLIASSCGNGIGSKLGSNDKESDSSGVSQSSAPICKKASSSCQVTVNSNPFHYKFIIDSNELPLSFRVHTKDGHYFDTISCDQDGYCNNHFSSEIINYPISKGSKLSQITVTHHGVSGLLDSTLLLFPIIN